MATLLRGLRLPILAARVVTVEARLAVIAACLTTAGLGIALGTLAAVRWAERGR